MTLVLVTVKEAASGRRAKGSLALMRVVPFGPCCGVAEAVAVMRPTEGPRGAAQRDPC
ncbi:hypothetical protein GCM10010306_066410 [Streptomyces umbrinus]|nr:hypothetical protein GCM10010306_066410 [Streptomyces umbrinus]